MKVILIASLFCIASMADAAPYFAGPPSPYVRFAQPQPQTQPAPQPVISNYQWWFYNQYNPQPTRYDQRQPR